MTSSIPGLWKMGSPGDLTTNGGKNRSKAMRRNQHVADDARTTDTPESQSLADTSLFKKYRIHHIC